MTMNTLNEPGAQRPSLNQDIATYFYVASLQPSRDRGRVR